MAEVIPLDDRAIEYQTDAGISLRAGRAYVESHFLSSAGSFVPFASFLDCAAPFSVIPYALWHDQKLAWKPLGQLLRDGKPDPTALQWFGVPCELAELQFCLWDSVRGIRTRTLRLVAKLPMTPAPPHKAAILGYNLLTDNSLHFTLEGVGGRMVGALTVP